MHRVPQWTPRPFSEVERRLGTKWNTFLVDSWYLSLGDLIVSEALLRLEQGNGPARGDVGKLPTEFVPTFELPRAGVGDWHREGCEHPTLKLTADELVYVTLRLISDEVIHSHERYGVSLAHTNCAEWSSRNGNLVEPQPTCEQLAVAAKRLGYKVRPVARADSDHVSNEHGLHYEFLNGTDDGRLLLRHFGQDATYLPGGYLYHSTGPGGYLYHSTGLLDRVECRGDCKCGCKARECESSYNNARDDCECAGCYCSRTCVPAASEEHVDNDLETLF